jgi:hypothetical protein
MGKIENVQFALRIPKLKLDKMKYIAEYNGRSTNKEFEMLAIKHIEAFEKIHGSINLDDKDPQ